MNNLQQLVLTTKRAFDAYSDINSEVHINTDGFDAQIKFDNLWKDCTTAIYTKYVLPSFYVNEDGFHLGDATPDELENTVILVNSVEGRKVVTAESIFEFLNEKFLTLLKPKVEQLVIEFNKWCKKELES